MNDVSSVRQVYLLGYAMVGMVYYGGGGTIRPYLLYLPYHGRGTIPYHTQNCLDTDTTLSEVRFTPTPTGNRMVPEIMVVPYQYPHLLRCGILLKW